MTAQGDSIAAAIQSYIGHPYVWGGVGPISFDCSGLVQKVYANLGLNLLRTSEQQATQVTPTTDPQPGDLAFGSFHSKNDHVGIYVGGGKVVSALDESHGVTTTSSHWPGMWFGTPNAQVPGVFVPPANTPATVPGGGASTVTGPISTQPSAPITAPAQTIGLNSTLQTLLAGTIGPNLEKFGIKPDFSGLILLFGSLFAIIIGAMIWRGNDVKGVAKQVPQAAVKAAL